MANNKSRKQGQNRIQTATDVDKTRLSSDMGETSDSPTDSNLVDTLTDRSSQAQRSSRVNQDGELGGRKSDPRPEALTSDREIDEDREATQRVEDRR